MIIYNNDDLSSLKQICSSQFSKYVHAKINIEKENVKSELIQKLHTLKKIKKKNNQMN